MNRVSVLFCFFTCTRVTVVYVLRFQQRTTEVTDAHVEMKGWRHAEEILLKKGAEVNGDRRGQFSAHAHALPVLFRLQRSTTHVQIQV